MANILAKAERYPIFIVDHGVDGKTPKLVMPAALVTAQFVAGSMGLIARVPTDPELISALQRLSAGPYEITVSLAKLVLQIYHHWPEIDLSLRPGLNNGVDNPLISKTQILGDLVKIAPLIAGCFAPMCGNSHRLGDQIMARAACNSLRLRDLSVKDLEANDKYLLRIYVALRRILLHPQTPVWPFHLLEDILSVPIQELIRYSPDLYHLRSRHHYGQPVAIARTEADQDIPGAHHLYELVNAVRGQEHEIMAGLYPVHDAIVPDDQKLALRNHGMLSIGQAAIPDRFDLDVRVDVISGQSWTVSELGGYIQYMSFRCDWGRFPSADTVDLILPLAA